MSISSLRWRVSSALITAPVAAAAMLAPVVPAWASTGPREISPEQAGYTATGARFTHINATIYLRQPAQYASEVGQYSHSVQLWSSGLVVILGVTASTSGSRYVPYTRIFDRSSHQLIASNPGAQWCGPQGIKCTSTIGSYPAGHTVELSLTYDPEFGTLYIVTSDLIPPGGKHFSVVYTATGQSFTQARVGTEFGPDPWTPPSSYTPPAEATKIAVYSDVLLSTARHSGTLWSTWVHHKLLANTEQQSGHDWVAIPHDLTNGGANFQTWFVPQSGQGRT